VQQSADWFEVISACGEDEAFHFVARNDLVIKACLSAYLFEGSAGRIMLSSPLPGSYGGIASECLPPEEAEHLSFELLRTFTETARMQRASLATIISAPFHGDPERWSRVHPPAYLHENFFQYLDLTEPLGASLNSKGRSNLKRKIRLARESGFEVEVVDSTSPPLKARELVPEWHKVHVARMKEIGARPIPQSMFVAIVGRLLPKNKALIILAKSAGELIGGGIFIGQHAIWDVYMMSSRSSGFEGHINSLITLTAIEHLTQKGVRLLNWQGSSSRDSGVYRYKAEWGSREGRYHYLTYETGETRALKSLTPEAIRNAYGWRFVLPYRALEQYRG
jgi:hypothetical protein